MNFSLHLQFCFLPLHSSPLTFCPLFRPSKKRKLDAQEADEFSIVQKPNEKNAPTAAVVETKSKEEPASRVILVRNVAFQASQNELTALFKPIGGLIKVRMPQKPSGGHRGFAFVEFSTEAQAKVCLMVFAYFHHYR